MEYAEIASVLADMQCVFGDLIVALWLKYDSMIWHKNYKPSRRH